MLHLPKQQTWDEPPQCAVEGRWTEPSPSVLLYGLAHQCYASIIGGDQIRTWELQEKTDAR